MSINLITRKSIPRGIIPYVYYFIFAILLFSDCKKEDFNSSAVYDTKELAISVFNLNNVNDTSVLRVVETLRKLDSKFNFMHKVSAEVGVPVWSKVIKPTPGKNLVTVNDRKGQDYFVVPMIKDTLNRKYIESIMLLHEEADSVKFFFIKKGDYKKYIDGNPTRVSSQQVMMLFMALDQKVFGYERFEVHDKLTFRSLRERVRGKYKDTSKTIILKLSESVAQDTNNSAMPTTEAYNCYTVTRYVLHEGNQGQLVGVTAAGTVDHSYIVEEVSFEVCSILTFYGWYPSGDYISPFGGAGGWGGATAATTTTNTTGECLDCGTSENGYTAVTDQRVLNNKIATPTNYPGMNRNFPWLWWEVDNHLSANIDAVIWNVEALNLDLTQAQYLVSHADINIDAIMFLESDEYSAESKFAAKTTIELLAQNTIEDIYSPVHLETINRNASLINCCNTGPILFGPYLSEVSRRTAAIKRENPSFSQWKCFKLALWEMAHFGLDLLGLIPVGGEIFDVLSGSLYVVEGDGVNAAFSFSASVPVAGWGGTLAKYARKYVDIGGNTRKALTWFKRADNTISFGKENSKQFRELLGLAKGDPRQAHHIIPWEIANNVTFVSIQKAASAKFPFHVQDVLNGIPLNSAQHLGSHPAYTARVTEALRLIEFRYGNNLTPEIAYQEIVNLTNRIKQAIISNPNISIENIIF